MATTSIQTVSFRNLEDDTVDVSAPTVFLVGENGQGKSNFLDALYTLSYGASFRGGTDLEAAKLGTKAWSLRRQSNDDTGLDDELVVAWDEGKKLLKENGKAIPDRKYLVDKTPAVVFCHGDMEFAQGEPERRRFFFDQTAGLVSLAYIDALRSYRRALKARNAALKEKMLDVLDILDIQLATYGTELIGGRKDLIQGFENMFSERYEQVSRLGSKVGLEYRPSWPAECSSDEINDRLLASREREVMFGTTLSGPHRDRFVFIDDHGDFSARASTGQLRLLALTLRIVQAEYCSGMSGKLPLLLLDDVLLELDPEKRRRFMENLPAARKAVFTFLPGEPYGDYRSVDTAVYWVEHGRLSNTAGV